MTTLTLNNLTPGDSYKVQIRSRYYNADRSVHESSGPWTATATQRVKNHPPTAPNGLAASQVSHDSLTLTWDDPQDANITGYRVMRGPDAGSLSTLADTQSDSTSFTDSTVEPETTYHYGVLALSQDGDGAQSTTSVTTPAEPDETVQNDPPAVPKGLVASRTGHSVLTLTWHDPQDDNITGYRVLRGPGADNLSAIKSDTGSNGTEYEDDTVAPETTYFYAVLALSENGDGAQSATLSATTPAEPKTKDEPRRVGARQSPPPITLVSNQSQIPDINATYTRDHGQAFTTGSEPNGYIVNSVVIRSEDPDSDAIPLKICEVGSDESPTDDCWELTAPLTFPNLALLTYTAGTRPALTLEASTTYMVLLSAPSSTELRVDATSSTGEDSGSLAGWSIRDKFQWYNTSNMWADAGSNRAIRITINGRVRAANTPATGGPTISGGTQVGHTLTATTDGITDPNGVPFTGTYTLAVAWQWKRVDSDGTSNPVDIGTDATYTLTSSDLGKRIKVEASYKDDDGYSEGPLASAAYPLSGTVTVNTPPTSADGTVTQVEDSRYIYMTSDFHFSDSDGNALGSVKITELPAAGTLSMNNVPITDDALPQTVPAASGSFLRLEYEPPENGNGTPFASFKFRVNDGAEDSADEYTMTINITPVNDPPLGRPRITGVGELGETLSAVTVNAISDVDGLPNPSTYTYQWKRYSADGNNFEADIGTNSSSYTVAASEEGKTVKVEVSFTDDDGTLETLISPAFTVDDTTSPEFKNATVSRTVLVITFIEPLAAAGNLANSAFSGKKTPSGGSQTALTLSGTAPAISGSTVTLTLAAASSVVAADTNVLVSYTQPTSGSNNKLVDGVGNETATFTDRDVDNLLGESTAPELDATNAAVLAADGLTLTLTYNEALRTASVPDRAAFTVEATPPGASEETISLVEMDGVTVAGSTVVLTLARRIVHDETSVKVSYTEPQTGAVIEDANGNDAPAFRDQAVMNNSTVPRVRIEAVHPEVSSLIALPVLRVTRSIIGADDLRVDLNVTQTDSYVTSGMGSVIIEAGQMSAMGTISLDYPGNTNGDLTLTVAPGDDYAPALAPDNAATMLVKAPASGLPLAVRHDQTRWTVNEGETADVTVTFTLAPGLADPRDAYELELHFEPEEPEPDEDYVDASTNFVLKVLAAPGDWQPAGGGGLTQTVTISTETIQDTEVEANERFYLDFSNANNEQSLDIPLDDPQGRTTVFILDDDPLELTGVAVTSMPTGGYYGVGDSIEFTVTFNAYMLLTGQPLFDFELGGVTRQALGQETEDEMDVLFQYTVVAGDADDRDGISWGANALRLNGGSIVIYAKAEGPGIPRHADLDHGRQDALSGHKVDFTNPTLASATVNGTALVMNFNEPLAAAAGLANSAFAVKKGSGGTAQTLSGTPSISGSKVTLTLGTTVSASDTDVLVSYTKPSSGSANKLVDLAGNETATFTDQPVGNLLADSTAPALANTNTAVLAADGLTLTLTYNEALKTTSVPDRAAFTVKATPLGGSEETTGLAGTSGVSVTGSTVVLKLARPVAHNDGSVKVTYTKPGTGAVIEDATGNAAAGFTDQSVTNNSTVPRVSIEAVHADATPGIAPPTFRLTRSLNGSGRLEVNIEATQADNYASSLRTVRFRANQTTQEFSHGNTYTGNTSGPLTITVAGGDDYLPALAPNDSATLQMKVAASGLTTVISQPPVYSVREGELVNERLIVTTGAGVAEPRAEFQAAVYTEAATATINVDYNHISGNVSFPVDGWTTNSDGSYTQTAAPTTRIRTIQDNEPEADETFTVHLQNTPGVSQAIIIDRTIVTATIVDDDILEVQSVAVTSTPNMGAYYQAAETISFTVAFNAAVTVTGTPQFTFELDGQTRQAAYDSGSDTKELVFTYTVVSGDDDHDGISWSDDALDLNGGAIKFMHTDPAEQDDAQLGHAVQAALADHKVDTTTPTLVSASLNRTTMTLIFSEELKPTAPAAAAFTVKVNGGAGVAPTAASLSGRVATLTLGTTARHDQTVTVSYAPPGTNKLQDLSGKEVAAFTDSSVENEAFMLDCTDSSAVWCSDLEFSDQTAENWGWAYLKYGWGYDPPASLSDQAFKFRGTDYTIVNMTLRPGTHPVMPNAWSTEQQGYSSFNITIKKGASLRDNPAEDHYQDWVLHLERLTLPFKDALPYDGGFLWVGPEIQEIFSDWDPSLANRIGIQEVLVANQTTNPLLPWAPMQVDASPQGPDGLRINWAKPAWTNPGLPEPTRYIVQWKLATASWDDGTAVSDQEVAAGSSFHSLTIDGLTRNSLYSVRVIAANDAGNGPPSRETLGRPQDGGPQLLAQTVNGLTLTLRFSDQLAASFVPAATSFVVMADGGLIAVDSVAISGDQVVLTLNRAVTAANSVLVRYDKPTDTAGVFLQDNSGNHAQVARHLELLPAVNATSPSTVLPLAAQFTNPPTSHNGRDPFTFDIEFSEPVWIGIGLARDDMLEVTGGTVTSAPWKDRRSDKITVHVQPDGDGDIVILLPGNRTCAGIVSDGDSPGNAGAPCAIGNRVLINVDPVFNVLTAQRVLALATGKRGRSRPGGQRAAS